MGNWLSDEEAEQREREAEEERRRIELEEAQRRREEEEAWKKVKNNIRGLQTEMEVHSLAQNAMETVTSHPVGGLIGRLQSSRLENADGK